jgi:Lon protease-like protein
VSEDTLKISDLPSVIPVFPLSGVILLPGSNLPLNIFEPRYLQMVKDARASHSLIGMIQPQDPEDASGKPATYAVGCVGRITHHSETEDGRNLIRLTGLCRFNCSDEMSVMTPYRQMQVNWAPYNTDLDICTATIDDRDGLMSALKIYLDQKGLDADYEGINTAPDNVLVNTLSMIVRLTPAEKQALLEAQNINARAETLKSLLTMATTSTTSGPSDKLS